MLKKIVRDNNLVNPIIRNCIRLLVKKFKRIKTLVNKYRIYGIVKVEVNEVQFKIYSEADDFIANELYYNVAYELGEFKLLKQLLIKSKYFVDIGANTGVFSIYAGIINKELSVLSFEPHPSNYKRLSINISLNNLINVKPLSLAVGATERMIEFTVPDDLRISTTASANEAFTRNFHQIKFKEIQVKQVTLNTALAELDLTSCDLIKIDVEYCELEVLKGAINILKEKRPMIVLEILSYNALIKQFPNMTDRISGNNADEIVMFFIELGYYGYAILEQGLIFVEGSVDYKNRNFLYMPYELESPNLTFYHAP